MSNSTVMSFSRATRINRSSDSVPVHTLEIRTTSYWTLDSLSVVNVEAVLN